MTLALLIEVEARYGGKAWPVLELIDAWAARVLKLLNDIDAGLTTADAEAWSIHDLIGSFYLRDSIENSLSSVKGVAAGRRVASLEAVDRLFRGMTTEDAYGIVRLVEQDGPGDGWWWNRVPSAGPIADEIREIVLNRRGSSDWS
jgi:hypothetical protein